MEKTIEFNRRILFLAKRLNSDYQDLLDWYKNDIDDIVEMDGKELMKIIKEYIRLRSFYRKRNNQYKA